MRIGLTERILIGGGLIAVFFAVQFVLSIQSFHGIRHDTREQQHAQQAVVAAIRFEKLVLDLETGTRGYVITADRQFLQPYEAARRALPGDSATLRSLAPGSFSTELDRMWRSYLAEYAIPLINQAAHSRAAARAKVATGEGKRRIDRIRGMIDPFVERENAVAVRDQQRVENSEHLGVVLGVIGSAVRLLALAAIIAYLLRWVVAPIRRIAAATRRVAAGGLDVAVPEGGPGEIGELARSFNEMSLTLTRHQLDLADQNVELERLANVLRAVLDSTIDGILLSDAEGHMQLANRPIVRLTREMGMSYDGTIVDRLLSVEHRVRDREAYRKTMELSL